MSAVAIPFQPPQSGIYRELECCLLLRYLGHLDSLCSTFTRQRNAAEDLLLKLTRNVAQTPIV